MDDLKLLSSFLADRSGLSFGECLLRNTLDFTSARAHQDLLVGLRWHFLLGTVPLDYASVEEFRAKTTSALERILREWQDACLKRGANPQHRGSSPTTNTSTSSQCVSIPNSAARRLAKFDSSSSSEEDESGGGASHVGLRWRCAGRTRVAEVQHTSAAAPTTLVNPLCPGPDSRYAAEFQRELIRREIQKDLGRLHWEMPLFESPQTKANIGDMLLSYCVGQGLGYRQGMHEIAAFCYYVGYRDRTILSPEELDEPFSTEKAADDNGSAPPPSSSSPMTDALNAWVELYDKVSSRDHQVACAFALFCAIMRTADSEGFGLASWYYSARDLLHSPTIPKQTDSQTCADAVGEQSGVVVAAERVQQDLLVLRDAGLQHRLDSDYGIQGAVYLIRWLRLLFLREFSVEQNVSVWSALFAEMRLCRYRGKGFELQVSLALHLAAAMLVFVKDDLMTDSTRALQRLMHYPPVEDIRVLLSSAVSSSTNSLLHVYAKFPRRPQPIAIPAKSVASGTLSTSDDGAQADSAGEAAAVVMARQGARLSAIVNTLERYWFPAAEGTGPSEEERERTTNAYVQAIAELKKIRDVLLFGVDD